MFTFFQTEMHFSNISCVIKLTSTQYLLCVLFKKNPLYSLCTAIYFQMFYYFSTPQCLASSLNISFLFHLSYTHHCIFICRMQLIVAASRHHLFRLCGPCSLSPSPTRLFPGAILILLRLPDSLNSSKSHILKLAYKL